MEKEWVPEVPLDGGALRRESHLELVCVELAQGSGCSLIWKQIGRVLREEASLMLTVLSLLPWDLLGT